MAVFAIISGMSNSIYIVLVKYYHNKYKYSFNIALVLGYVGIYCMIIIPVLLCILTMTGYEVDMPEIETMINFLMYICLSSIIRNILTAYVLVYLSPLVFNFGLTLKIPVSYFTVYLIGLITLDFSYFIGLSCIFASFILLLVCKFKELNSDRKNTEQDNNMSFVTNAT